MVLAPPVAEACDRVDAASAIDAPTALAMAPALKALADPLRLRMLSMLAASPTGEACACDLVEPLGRSQPTVSHHLSLLVDAGLLTREKRGRWAWYRVVPERLAVLRDALSVPADGSPGCC